MAVNFQLPAKKISIHICSLRADNNLTMISTFKQKPKKEKISLIHIRHTEKKKDLLDS